MNRPNAGQGLEFPRRVSGAWHDVSSTEPVTHGIDRPRLTKRSTPASISSTPPNVRTVQNEESWARHQGSTRPTWYSLRSSATSVEPTVLYPYQRDTGVRDRSLRRLAGSPRVDVIDLYYQHRVRSNRRH